MTADLLEFPNPGDEDVAIELDQPVPVAVEDDDPQIELDAEEAPATSPPTAAIQSAALMEVLPADFKLPALIKFVPNPALRHEADVAAVYALSVAVDEAEGLQRADLALTALRTSLRAIEEHLEEPIAIANELHKRLTGVRADWLARGKAAVQTVGQRVFAEQRRLEAVAAEARRKAQADADREARAAAQREVEAAAHAAAPAQVVEELKRQAETATAAPVASPHPAPVLRGSSTVTTWKARIAGTPGSDEPNPAMEQLSAAQRHRVFELLRAILDGKAPLAAVELNWSYLNKRAKADKSTLAIPGVEAYEEGGVRAKSTRAKT